MSEMLSNDSHGVVAFVAVMAVGESEVFTRAEVAFVVGGVVSVVWMAIAARRSMRRLDRGMVGT